MQRKSASKVMSYCKFIYYGKKSNLIIKNILPLIYIPEETVVCNVEHHVGDRGAFAGASGDYAIIISYNLNNGTSRIKLPFGAKKIVPSGCCAMVGQVVGGGRTEKPMLKEGNAYHKYRVKCNCWPKVRCVAMNLVEYPHGGGNHQYISHASIVRRDAPPGQKIGLIVPGGLVVFVGKLLLTLPRLISEILKWCWFYLCCLLSI